MALTVLRGHDGAPNVFEDVAEGIEVLLFDPIEERGDLPIGERFRMIERSLQIADAVIFRSSSRVLVNQLNSDNIVSELLADTDAYCLQRSYDPSERAPQLIPLGSAPADLPAALHEIREAEFRTILRDTGSLIRVEGHHYLLPSGWHSEGFLRLANATRSIPASRRIADWLLEHIDETTALLADTGTILPLLLEAQRHCKKHFGWKCRIDALESYPTVKLVQRAIADLRRRHGEDNNSVLFVVSVSSSGGSLRRFNASADGEHNDRSLVLVETDAAADPVVAPLLRLPLAVWRPDTKTGTCDGCNDPAHVQIDPGSYEQMQKLDVVARPVSPKLAERLASFFQVASDLDALHLHHDARNGTHYAVWLDTPRLLAHPPYRESLEALVREKAHDADLVLVPDGPAVEPLCELSRSALGKSPQVVGYGQELPATVLDSLLTAEHIVIIDDTISTGTTLGRLRRLVFNAARRHDRNPDMTAVVFAARTALPSQLDEVKRPYRNSNPVNVHSLHELHLPAGSNCPWCDEIQLLRAWLPKLSPESAERAQERIEELQGGIQGALLLGADGPSDLKTVRSFFGELHERAAFAAASAAVVTMQHQLDASRTAGSVEIVDVGPALDAYFDEVLLSGILRTVKPVRLTSFDAALISRYEKMAAFGDALNQAARAELAWAVVSDVLPHVGFEPLIADISGPDAALMRELLRLRHEDLI